MSNTVDTQDERALLVSVVGDAAVKSSKDASIAEELGRLLIDTGYRLVTGGLGGIMECACRGARSSSRWTLGCVIGLLPGYDPDDANPWVDTVLPTGLDVARNTLVARTDALVAIGGGAGTLSEMATAWQLHRLILGCRTGGWSGRLADQRVDDRVRYAEIADDRVYGFDRACDAVELLRELIPRYRRVHTGMPRARRPASSS